MSIKNKIRLPVNAALINIDRAKPRLQARFYPLSNLSSELSPTKHWCSSSVATAHIKDGAHSPIERIRGPNLGNMSYVADD